MPTLKTSIAMAACNGAEYIREQLDSIARQTLPPDELIVCDDCSEDETVEIIRDFQHKSAFPVKLVENKKRLGCSKNFENALSKCSGELIFFSDQDDVWFDDKIATMAAFMDSHPDAMVGLNDTEITDEDLSPTGLLKSRQTLNLGLSIESFQPGCCMVFRSVFKELILPVPDDCFAYDTWVNKLATLLGVRAFLDVPLQYYRRHGANTSNWVGSSIHEVTPLDLARAKGMDDPRKRCALRTSATQALKERLKTSTAAILTRTDVESRLPQTIRQLEDELKAVEQRSELLKKKRPLRLMKALKMLFNQTYAKHFSGYQSFAKDLFWK